MININITFSQKLIVSADDQSLAHVSVGIPDFDRPPSSVRVTRSRRWSPLLKGKCCGDIVRIHCFVLIRKRYPAYQLKLLLLPVPHLPLVKPRKE